LYEFSYIVRDPEICGGQPTIKGTRVLVLDILDLIKAGRSFDDILEEFPSIKRVEIEEILSYAKALIEGEVVVYATKTETISP